MSSSVARRFAREGFSVGLIARTPDTIREATRALGEHDVRVTGRLADAGDEAALRTALDELTETLGTPGVLVYNAGLIRADRLGELSAEEHCRSWGVNVTAAAHVGPSMADAGGGTILLTGGLPRPHPDQTSLSLGKAGVRALTEILDTEFAPAGIHAATVTVGGAVAPGPRSTRTTSPRSTGGCTASPGPSGSARFSTQGVAA